MSKQDYYNNLITSASDKQGAFDCLLHKTTDIIMPTHDCPDTFAAEFTSSNNYRPISNLPYLSNLIERAMAKQHETVQSAYCKHHSTKTSSQIRMGEYIRFSFSQSPQFALTQIASWCWATVGNGRQHRRRFVNVGPTLATYPMTWNGWEMVGNGWLANVVLTT